MRSKTNETVDNHRAGKASVSRRTFLQHGSLILAGTSLLNADQLLAAEPSKSGFKVGILTDCHYADRNPAGSRVYRESLGKVREAVDFFNKEKAQVVAQLGDFIDAAPNVESEIGHLKAIEAEFERFEKQRAYVLGNHCVYTLTKEEFIDNCGMPAAHYSFDAGGYHFVVLDACYRSDGVPYGRKNYSWKDANVPKEELEWLKGDLAATKLPTVVLAHQRLDQPPSSSHAVKNAAEVRKVLEESERVKIVFQGHAHVNDHKLIGDIHYCTMIAVVEGKGEANNAYALAEFFPDGSIRIDGQRKQSDYAWQA
jgi:predicted phosphodiesterase